MKNGGVSFTYTVIIYLQLIKTLSSDDRDLTVCKVLYDQRM